MKEVPELEYFDINYSLKNIPIGNHRAYIIKLYDMVNKFINRLRWRAYYYEKKLKGEETEDESEPEDNGYYRFPTKRYGPWRDKLAGFENDLFKLIKRIKFRRLRDEFQNSLAKDVKRIKNSNKVIAFADKTNNLYKMEPDDYKKLLLDNITKDYKKCDPETMKRINSEANDIIVKHAIKGKIAKFQTSEPFVSIKDHKDRFPNLLACRLINPSKTNIGKVSKGILDRINNSIRSQSKLTQWKNSQEVIQWFEKIDKKAEKRFICFDIVSFYPSIKRQHVLEAIEFAKDFTSVSEGDIEIIMHACKSTLINDDQAWEKKDGSGLFDIPMGSYHGAEICDLIGLNILHKIRKAIPDGDFGLYRDDGLGITKRQSPSQFERLKKKIIRLFSDAGFKITIQTGDTVTNFLDVTLNLRNNTFSPFRKPNATIQYVHCSSNHPPHVKRALPGMIERRLTSLSKSQKIFDASKGDYEDALKRSGYKNSTLTFHSPEDTRRPKHRNRRKKAIFFNAPFCRSVKTKVGKEFFKIVDRHFTKSHPYYDIFNRKTIKLSYSCMMNMKNIIKAHNSKTLQASKSQADAPKKTCNCRKSRKHECPLRGNCLAENVIYKATIETSTEEREYIGSTGRKFKERYSEHKHALTHRDSPNSTALSEHVWSERDKGEKPVVRWSILHQTPKPSGPQRICTLCNLERMEIAAADRKKAVNKKSELTGSCLHYKGFYFPRRKKKAKTKG